MFSLFVCESLIICSYNRAKKIRKFYDSPNFKKFPGKISGIVNKNFSVSGKTSGIQSRNLPHPRDQGTRSVFFGLAVSLRSPRRGEREILPLPPYPRYLSPSNPGPPGAPFAISRYHPDQLPAKISTFLLTFFKIAIYNGFKTNGAFCVTL